MRPRQRRRELTVDDRRPARAPRRRATQRSTVEDLGDVAGRVRVVEPRHRRRARPPGPGGSRSAGRRTRRRAGRPPRHIATVRRRCRRPGQRGQPVARRGGLLEPLVLREPVHARLERRERDLGLGRERAAHGVDEVGVRRPRRRGRGTGTRRRRAARARTAGPSTIAARRPTRVAHRRSGTADSIASRTRCAVLRRVERAEARAVGGRLAGDRRGAGTARR